jgi:peptide/nickel transport system ATP-binding protein
MKQNILEIRELKVAEKRRDNRSLIVKGVDLTIRENTICSLVGKSGSGKSLLAASIMGILASNLYSEGEILYRDKKLFELSKEQLNRIRGKHIGIVMQNCSCSLNPLVKNGRQLSIVLKEHLSKKDRRNKQAEELLRSVKLENPRSVMNRYPHELSGGMKQRLLTAIGIGGAPELLIMDEPTKGMDVILRNQMADMIYQLHKKTNVSILMITHDLELAYNISHDCYVMNQGRITTHGETKKLFETTNDCTLIDLINAQKMMTEFFAV